MALQMEVIAVPELFDMASIERVVENTLNMTALAVKVDFNVTQRTFKRKHVFRIRKKKNERIVSTDSLIYHFLNDGTKRHPIPKRPGAKMLRFQWGGPGSYKPKTLTRKILSRQGGSTGPMVSMKKVMHPGTEARKFDEVIAEKWDKELPTQMQRAIDAEV